MTQRSSDEVRVSSNRKYCAERNACLILNGNCLFLLTAIQLLFLLTAISLG